MSNNQPFVMTPTAVIFDTTLPALVRVCFSALEDFSGVHRTCWPGYEAIAEKVGCSARWVPELLKKLVEAGLLVIQYRQGRTNIYTLLGRVSRQKAAQEVTAPAPKKSINYEQKQPTKTNNKRASQPLKGNVDFSKWLPGGENEKFTRPLGS